MIARFLWSSLLLLGGMAHAAAQSCIASAVTTFDLVLISRHILGLEALDSPYKMIAADVNMSGTISTSDVHGHGFVLSDALGRVLVRSSLLAGSGTLDLRGIPAGLYEWRLVSGVGCLRSGWVAKR